MYSAEQQRHGLFHSARSLARSIPTHNIAVCVVESGQNAERKTECKVPCRVAFESPPHPRLPRSATRARARQYIIVRSGLCSTMKMNENHDTLWYAPTHKRVYILGIWVFESDSVGRRSLSAHAFLTRCVCVFVHMRVCTYYRRTHTCRCRRRWWEMRVRVSRARRALFASALRAYTLTHRI